MYRPLVERQCALRRRPCIWLRMDQIWVMGTGRLLLLLFTLIGGGGLWAGEPEFWLGRVAPRVELQDADWRRVARSPERSSGPGAVVVVVGRLDSGMPEEDLAEMRAWLAPRLVKAYEAGARRSYTREQLAEFMVMDARNVCPASVPAFWYNALWPGESRGVWAWGRWSSAGR